MVINDFNSLINSPSFYFWLFVPFVQRVCASLVCSLLSVSILVELKMDRGRSVSPVYIKIVPFQCLCNNGQLERT